MRDKGDPAADTLLKPLHKIQNKCLRRITGGYKRTPRAALEKETGIPPIDLYIDTVVMQRAATVRNHPIERHIKHTLDSIWATAPRGQRRARRPPPRPKSGPELLLERAQEREEEIRGLLAHRAEIAQQSPAGRRRPARRRDDRQGGHQHRYKPATLISRWADITWRKRWEKEAYGRRASTWLTPWTVRTIPLYEGLTKAEATALFLLRTEVIGLKAWLASIQVPGILPHCPCGRSAQTVRHTLLHCPLYNRNGLFHNTRTQSLIAMLSHPDRARAAARWFINQDILDQFRTAKEIAQEDTQDFAPLPDLSLW